MRKLEQCLNCAEEREIAAFHLCFKCYRQHERALSRGPVDKHTAVITKERQKLFLAYAQLMTSLAKLGVNKTDVESVVEIVRPYLTPISEQLRFAGMATGKPCEGTPAPPDLGHGPEEKAGTVNGEHDVLPFTVHRPEDLGNGGVGERVTVTPAHHPAKPALPEKHRAENGGGKSPSRKQCAKARRQKCRDHRTAKTNNSHD
jgi:hypothetical protein